MGQALGGGSFERGARGVLVRFGLAGGSAAGPPGRRSGSATTSVDGSASAGTASVGLGRGVWRLGGGGGGFGGVVGARSSGGDSGSAAGSTVAGSVSGVDRGGRLARSTVAVAARPSGSRCATASYSSTDPATAALSDPIAPRIGIRMNSVAAAADGRPEALALAADDDRERTAQVGLASGQRRIRLRAEDAQAVGAQVGQRPGEVVDGTAAGGARRRLPTPSRRPG